MKDYQEKLEHLVRLQDKKCKSCNKPFVAGEKIDLAHKVKASKRNYKVNGEAVIDHVLNLAATHSGNCNDAQNMSRAAHPVAADKLLETIKSLLKEQ